jgi:hypothetical protein
MKDRRTIQLPHREPKTTLIVDLQRIDLWGYPGYCYGCNPNLGPISALLCL